jgi:VanZ family protein
LNKKRMILWLPLAAWMAVIFCFSAMDAPASDHLSGGITVAVVKIAVPQYDDLPENEQQVIMDNTEYAIRKTAHAAEYAVLGILAVIVLLNYKKTLRFLIPAALSICAAYAASDETHQMFVSGRSPQVTDILIDTGGAAAGIALAVLITLSYNKKKRRQNQRNA